MGICKHSAFVFICLLLFGGCRTKKPPPLPQRRPVTVITLSQITPAQTLPLTGSIEPWRQEDLGFEIGGTIKFVTLEDRDIQGRTYDEAGKRLTEGVVLASLDKTRFELAVDQAKAQLAAAKAQAKATKTELENVLPAEHKSAEAKLRQAKNELARVSEAFTAGAATSLEVERSEALVDIAQANIEQVQANIKAKKAELLRAYAIADQAAEQLKDTELDLSKCDLISPFSGRVSKLHVAAGAIVKPGDPAVQVTVMDPITIKLSVSPKTDRWIHVGDILEMFAQDEDEPVDGYVYSKSTVADPQLRTFQITVICRNRQLAVELPSLEVLQDTLGQENFIDYLTISQVLEPLWDDPQISPLLDDLVTDVTPTREDLKRIIANSKARMALLPLLTIKEILPVQTRDASSELPLYAEVRCIQSDDDGYFVWKVLDFEPVRPGQPRQPIVRLKKVPIEPGPSRQDYLGLFVYREFKEQATQEADPQDIEPELTIETILASGVPQWVQDDDQVLFLRLHWLFRPGNLAQVRLSGPGPGKGFFVPMEAITVEPGPRHVVYLAARGDDGQLRAKRVEIDLVGQIGSDRKIEAPEITDRVRVIVRGASQIVDDELIRIVGQEKQLQ